MENVESLDEGPFLKWVQENAKNVDEQLWNVLGSSDSKDDAAKKFVAQKPDIFDVYLKEIGTINSKPPKIDINSLPETNYDISDTESNASGSSFGAASLSSEEIDLLPPLTTSADAVSIDAASSADILPEDRPEVLIPLPLPPLPESVAETPKTEYGYVEEWNISYKKEPILPENPKAIDEKDEQPSNVMDVKEEESGVSISMPAVVQIVVDAPSKVKISIPLEFYPNKDDCFIKTNETKFIVGKAVNDDIYSVQNEVASMEKYADIQLLQQKKKSASANCFRNPPNLVIRNSTDEMFAFGFLELFRQIIQKFESERAEDSALCGYLNQLLKIENETFDFRSFGDHVVERLLACCAPKMWTFSDRKFIAENPLVRLDIRNEGSIIHAIEDLSNRNLILVEKMIVFEILNPDHKKLTIPLSLNSTQLSRQKMQFSLMQITLRFGMLVTEDGNLWCTCLNRTYKLEAENGKILWKESSVPTNVTNAKYIVYIA